MPQGRGFDSRRGRPPPNQGAHPSVGREIGSSIAAEIPVTGPRDRPADAPPRRINYGPMPRRVFRKKATASPGSDARPSGLTGVKSMQGLPAQGRRRLNMLVQETRFATLNVGSLTGRTTELAAALKRRRVDICALQETRWSGQKSRDIGDGFKVIFNGSPRTRNGVGIAVSKRYRDSVTEVHRFDDRLMKIVIIADDCKLHVFSGYASQAGCSDRVKDEFWTMLDQKTADVPQREPVIVMGDLNGHIGKRKDGHRWHGGHGYGERNDDGERILDYTDSHDLVIVNTFFTKRDSHLKTFYSGPTSSQIDFVLVRRRDFLLVTDAKAVPYETVTTQHRPVICTMRIEPPKQRHDDRTGPARTKWWRWKEKKAEVLLQVDLPPITDVETTWNRAKETITKATRAELGMTVPGRRIIDKMTWLWTDAVKEKVRQKKCLYHVFLDNRTPANWAAYRGARSEAKKSVAAAKAERYKDLYKKLDTREGKRDIYRLIRTRQQKTEDIEKFYGINDEKGVLITNRQQATERWRRYFEAISTQEFPHPPIPHADPVQGPVQPITTAEIEEALRRMKNGKATGPDDIATELWKSRSWNPTTWLTMLFNKIVTEKKAPTDWSRSITVPIWKKKGSPADCNNYRPIRLLSHTMKIFERVIDRRIREVIKMTPNQCGFIKNCGTTDAIHATRLLLEKHREKRQPLHVAFLDLEKAFDRVPHHLIWYALRRSGIPEELVNWVQLLYRDPKSHVQAAAGTSKDFRITVGVHQGSVLSPLLFIIIMDVITRDLHQQPPWTLLYADDVMLAATNKADLQHQVQAWSDRLARFGLRLNVKKTEYMTTDADI
uniref:Reverse transcriptase domain-containing protein n=1 Tax=Plectus sambesii TaxID=2011161 RepID=A0A914VFU1_9BILA